MSCEGAFKYRARIRMRLFRGRADGGFRVFGCGSDKGIVRDVEGDGVSNNSVVIFLC